MSLPTPPEFDDKITVTLHHLIDRLDSFADGMLRADFGLTYSQFLFLVVLASVGRPDVTEMSQCLGVSKAAVSKRLPSFVAAGWIELSGDPANARRVRMSLTPAGGELVGRSGAALDASFTEVFDDMPIDLSALHQQLKTIISTLESKGL